jgi:hypothetical protein
MIKVGDIPKKTLEKMDPSSRYKRDRKYLRDDQPYFFKTAFKPGVNEFIELIAEWYLSKWIVAFLTQSGIVGDPVLEYFNDYIPILESPLNWLGEELIKNVPEHRIIESRDGLLMIGYLRATQFFKVFKKEFAPLITKCDSCNIIFVARRKKTQYCDKCRTKVHIYRYRNKNRIALLPIKCEYKGCKKEFTPKTKRARFCSDTCRVSNNRFERAEIKERKILMEKIRVERSKSMISYITQDEVNALMKKPLKWSKNAKKGIKN